MSESEIQEYQKKIVRVLSTLPPGATVRQIARACAWNVSTRHMNELVNAGVVIQVERTEPPLIGYHVAPGWRAKIGEPLRAGIAKRVTEARLRAAIAELGHAPAVLASRFPGMLPSSIEQAMDHYGLTQAQEEPTLPEPPPKVGETLEQLASRVSREELILAMSSGQAIGAGLSLGAMAGRFRTTAERIKELIEHYQVWEEEKPVEPVTATKRPRMSSTQMAELRRAFAGGEGHTLEERIAMATQLGINLHTVNKHYFNWRRENPVVPTVATTPAVPGVEPNINRQLQIEALVRALAGGGLCATCEHRAPCKWTRWTEPGSSVEDGKVVYGPLPVVDCRHYGAERAG